jgi:hypothetical protein
MIRFSTVLATLAGLLMVLQVAALAWESALPAELPEGVGNRPEQVAQVKPVEGGRYRFGVIGDVQGADVGGQLTRALLAEDLHFLVFNGDLVRKGRPGYHRLLDGWFGALAPFPFPVFYAMGNRDLKLPEFTVKEWEERYGPSNFRVSVGGDLFVILRLADPWWPAEESLDFLERTLATERGSHRRVFVFTHVPPPFTPVIGTHCMLPEHWERVRRLCAAYRVDYWISGHFHGYVRESLGQTVMLISGGGGGGLHQDGVRHHAMVFEVGPDGVEERRIYGEGTANLLPGLRGAVVGEVYSTLAANPGPALAGNLLLLALLAWGLRTRRRE